MRNTDYAQRLDFEQNLDYIFENVSDDLEVKEYKAFIERCRKAKVSVKKLKMCEKEIKEQTAELKSEIVSLEYKLTHYHVGQCWYGKIYRQSDFDKWRTQLADKRRQLDNIINRIHYKYFK